MRTENERSLLDTQLIQLSYIFKKKFTVKVIGNKIIQYNNVNKFHLANQRFADGKSVNFPQDKIKYKTIIEIKDGRTIFKNGKIPDICIIRGWFGKRTDTYYIDLEI